MTRTRGRRLRRVRDFQRTKVYRWESLNVLPRDPAPISLEACRTLVARVFAVRQGVESIPPRVEDGRGRRHAAGSREVIKLPRWARTRPVVLHECAHGLSMDGHGPDFVRAYVELLVEFLDADRDDLERSLAAATVRISPIGHPIALPPVPARSVRIPRQLAARLLAIGVASLADLRSVGAVQAWVKLRQRFGQLVGQASLFTLASMGTAEPAAELDGRTRAHLKFEATRLLIEARRGSRTSGTRP